MPAQDAVSRAIEDPNDGPVEDDTVQATDPDEETVPIDADAWATAEGYTPLADLGGSEAMFMAYHPPSMDDDGDDGEDGNPYPSGGGVFFADPRAFEATISTDDAIDDDERIPVAGAESPEPEASEHDFRSLADQALSALDEEYALTLRAEGRRPGTAESEMQSAPMETSAAPVSCSNDVASRARLDDYSGLDAQTVALPRVEDTDSHGPTEQAVGKRELPPIDADAVRRAVQAIRLNAPDLTSNLDKWSSQQKQGDDRTAPPKEHTLIPSAPLAAFRKHSAKALRATANLSRSATLAEALCRLDCLPANSGKEVLAIHVVGADPVECNSSERVRSLFGPLVRWIGAMGSQSPVHIRIQLVGPNLPTTASSRTPVDLMPTTTLQSSSRLVSATAMCIHGVYHDWITRQLKSEKEWQHPDLAVAFNAGIWGYNEWRPTLQELCDTSQPIPFVITSYTIEEAEDDAEVVEQVLATNFMEMKQSSDVSSSLLEVKKRCLWRPEPNLFGSKQKRETATAVQGREYRENAAWQAWRLGGNETNESINA